MLREGKDLEEHLELEELEKEETEPEEVPKRFRENLYDKIKIPLKTMDLIIGILIAALVIFLAVGILQANIG